MDIEIFSLSDFAQVMGGKAVIAGVFDTLFPPQLPARMQCCLYWRVRFRPAEYGKHSFEISIINPDGSAMANPLQGTFEIGASPIAGIDSGVAEVAVGLSLEAKAFGKMLLNFKIDDKTLRSIPLYVLPPQRPN